MGDLTGWKSKGRKSGWYIYMVGLGVKVVVFEIMMNTNKYSTKPFLFLLQFRSYVLNHFQFFAS
jgi:hypothetical protein